MSWSAWGEGRWKEPIFKANGHIYFAILGAILKLALQSPRPTGWKCEFANLVGYVVKIFSLLDSVTLYGLEDYFILLEPPPPPFLEMELWVDKSQKKEIQRDDLEDIWMEDSQTQAPDQLMEASTSFPLVLAPGNKNILPVLVADYVRL